LENWSGMFRPGERVRLRIINASAMTLFNLRIPGLPMTVVMADGLPVQPVEVDEFQIGTAETFDVIVHPQEEGAFTIHAETIDRSGFARGTLASKPGLEAPVPPRRARPLLSMRDMGMQHEGMQEAPRPQTHLHPRGPGVASLASHPANRLSERPLGLEHEPHRVLVYADLRSLVPNPDPRAPERELEIHLTANMERYMWSFDGQKFSEVTAPVPFALNERVRIHFVNDTMMPHPLHLHGMFFDLVTGEHSHKPRKHTLVLKPGERAAVDLTADAPGPWAFHCHLLYHMHAGMMRVFEVGESGPT
jgi:FtsP/CotA-like multicopper oxidase with cupredoxin domain